MYNSNGDLVPIEINTNLGWDNFTIEYPDDIFNLNELQTLITANNFKYVYYIGGIKVFNIKLKELCESLNIEYYFVLCTGNHSIPYIEDREDLLIIRSAYDYSAIVDDYCKNKVNLLNLIKDQSFISEYNENIITIVDNGSHPNFILKAVYPQYDKEVYPKLYRVETQDQLEIVKQNINSQFHLVQFHYNQDKLYDNHIKLIRSFNLLTPPDLKSISIGQYTKITTRSIDELSTYNSETFELNPSDRNKYLIYSLNDGIARPKLLDTDEVEMADGTFKTAIQLQNDDVVKTIIIPNPNQISLDDDCGNFGIDYDTFNSQTTYSTNRILNKKKIDKLTKYVNITFSDQTTWEDTINSRYLVLRNDDVMFLNLDDTDMSCGMHNGDSIILVDTSQSQFTSVLKEIQSIEVTTTIFSGWEFEVEEKHIFLTRNENNTSYAAIEHNPAACSGGPDAQGTCAKGYCCSQASNGTCSVCA